VIDSGIEVDHPKLKGQIWQNPKEVPGGHDESDADQNGFIDDLHGWDFVKSRDADQDPVGHGTHIAGLIVDSSDKKALIMSLRYYDTKQSGDVNMKYSVLAIRYAIKMGAQIINYSGGGPHPDSDERSALLEASKKNILVVAAAGNDSRRLGQSGFYPATYGFSNILSVASTNAMGNLSRHSNFDPLKILLSAPGEKVLSSLPGHQLGRMSGTSQATAFVTGYAVRLMSQDTLLRNNPQAVIHRLSHLGRWQKNLVGITRSPSNIQADDLKMHLAL